MNMHNPEVGNMESKIERLEQEIRDLRSRMVEQHELQEQLFQAQKMESLANLAAGIAHDLNNILQSVLGYTQIALLEKNETDPDYGIFLKIEKIINKGCELTRQFLTFGHRFHSEFGPLDLNAKITEIKTLLQRTIPRMIHIGLELAGDLPLIKADSGQVDQVLMNMSINAKDAMPDGGKLVFKTENVTITNEHPVSRLHIRPGQYVLLSIMDTGNGILPDVKKRIFEPFFTTKEKGKGTGLGLAMAYAIIRNHNGFIDVFSQPGEGTVFKIYLPVIERPDQVHRAPQNQRIRGKYGSFGHEKILLVDDEADILKIGKEILEKHGYEVATATDGEEAITQYSRHAFDLVILDVGMPGMGGIKCLQEILAINNRAKILICSGYAFSDLVNKALALGATDYLSKPFQIDTLPCSARAVLNNQPCNLKN